MRTGKIVYSDRAGQGNTATVIQVVQERCAKLGIQHVVVASDSGETALRLWEALEGTSVSLISVPEHAGYAGGDAPSITPEKKKELEEKGVHVLICAHALSGVGRSITKKFGGITPTEIIAVGGSGGGADVAIVLKAAHMSNFFDLEIREILAKPRQRTSK